MVLTVDVGIKIGDNKRELWREKAMFVKIKKEMFKDVVIPTILYESKMMIPNEFERRSLTIFQVICSENMFTMHDDVEVRNKYESKQVI